MLQGKKILFFSANFFGYQEEITKKLETMGAAVSPYDERPKNTFWYKALIRLDKRLLKKRLDSYYSTILDRTAHIEYDYVFFLKAEAITSQMLIKMKERQQKAKFILYMWDSIDNCPSVRKLFPFFDRIFSFDPIDVRENKFMTFRPLFYLDDYKNLQNQKNSPSFNLSFVGTGHTDRYEIISKIKEVCNRDQLNYFFFIFMQDIRIFYSRKLFSKSFKKAKKSDFSFKPLNKEEILQIIGNSNCILDIERPVQRGLTMRTIEILGAKKKLLTTNKDILNYDFYTENNIQVIDRTNPMLSKEFIKGAYEEIDEKVYERYSLEYWINEVFE